MAKKRSTLPKNFQELLDTGDVEALKQVFDKCDYNATGGYSQNNAFSFAPLPREFASWLKEQGGEVDKRGRRGSTGLYEHCGHWRGDAALLLELGADPMVTNDNGETPLHTAARYGRTKAITALLEHGANPNTKSHDPVWKTQYLPLEVTLQEQRLPLDLLLQVVELLLDAGSEKTATMQEFVKKIGKKFAFYKTGYSEENRLKAEQAMDQLYAIFDVEPVPDIVVHDGVSPIVIEETTFTKQYQKLWEYLVPGSGPAKTAQGEAIRIAGKVAYEILDNGGMNWNKDFVNMLDAFVEYLQMGVPLSDGEIATAKELVKALRGGRGEKEPEQLDWLAVKWILQNPTVLPPMKPNYKR